jgi:glycosyltransferase involved in cell wall biosynthesis
MRVFVNARIPLGGAFGGVQQFIEALTQGLAQLDTGHEIVFATFAGQEHWLEPLLGPGMRVVAHPPRATVRAYLGWQIRKRLSPLKRIVSPASPRKDEAPDAVFGRFVDSMAPDVCHFPWQEWVPTRAPSVLNLHDLQHLHFPQFFPPDELERRTVWAAWARQAGVLPVHSEWTGRDFVEKLGVPAGKIRVLPGASPLERVPAPTEELLEQLRRRFGLPERFALYPATTWPHKNHVRLAEALAAIDHPDATVICTGFRTAAWETVEDRVAHLGLGDRFRFLDFVTPLELKALYHLATFVVVPSLFEGGGSAVMYEALGEGAALACSNIPTIAEGVRKAALLFDPTSVDGIAQAMKRILDERGLVESLRTASREIGAGYTLTNVARHYVEIYEELARIGVEVR